VARVNSTTNTSCQAGNSPTPKQFKNPGRRPHFERHYAIKSTTYNYSSEAGSPKAEQPKKEPEADAKRLNASKKYAFNNSRSNQTHT
jgi:hypothetical protein